MPFHRLTCVHLDISAHFRTRNMKSEFGAVTWLGLNLLPHTQYETSMRTTRPLGQTLPFTSCIWCIGGSWAWATDRFQHYSFLTAWNTCPLTLIRHVALNFSGFTPPSGLVNMSATMSEVRTYNRLTPITIAWSRHHEHNGKCHGCACPPCVLTHLMRASLQFHCQPEFSFLPRDQIRPEFLNITFSIKTASLQVSRTHGYIFSLTAGSCDYGLFPWAPAYCSPGCHENICACRFSIIYIACPIGVGIPTHPLTC